MSNTMVTMSAVVYRALRPFIFLTDSEWAHDRATDVGEFIGRHPLVRSVVRAAWDVRASALKQTIDGIHFENPVGLAAGFDYRARLTQIIGAIGFGFGTVGTITQWPYQGNPKPRMGRLVKSRALVVNKGFKNDGIIATLARLRGVHPEVPIGLSVGKTNSQAPMTQQEAVEDILATFTAATTSGISFAYYELNISCPNLHGNAEFYSSEHLEELLKAVDGLSLSRPVWIKMPIHFSDPETTEMLAVIARHHIQGVIFGNLQRNRSHPSLDVREVARYPHGSISGVSTQARSDELVRLAYRQQGTRFTIVGCGGIFTAQDAYRKIRNGASLVQLVTGLIYEGPQLAAQINAGLLELLERDGLSCISDAVGRDAHEVN